MNTRLKSIIEYLSKGLAIGFGFALAIVGTMEAYSYIEKKLKPSYFDNRESVEIDASSLLSIKTRFVTYGIEPRVIVEIKNKRDERISDFGLTALLADDEGVFDSCSRSFSIEGSTSDIFILNCYNLKTYNLPENVSYSVTIEDGTIYREKNSK